MRREDYVSFEVARMLKENMYHWPCDSLYTLEGILKYRTIPDDFNRLNFYSRPCLYDAKKWLREIHNIFLVVIPHYGRKYDIIEYEYKIATYFDILEKPSRWRKSKEYYEKYEQCLNAGILEALKLICL